MVRRPFRLMGVFAHPDDETFCAGGTLARYATAGTDTAVISATRGEAGQIRDARVALRRTLAEVRERELRLACQHLGIGHVQFLGHADGALASLPPGQLSDEIFEHLRRFRADVVITFGEDGAYGHPDHVAVSAATTEACFRLTDEREADDAPVRLYYSHFPRSRLLLLDRLARWLDGLQTRFRGSADFARALTIFSQETATLGYVSDHVRVAWFPAGAYVIEQGEKASALYLILDGRAEIFWEDGSGRLHRKDEAGPGEFLGERGLARGAPRNAHVVAADNVTCLVMSPSAPAAYTGRGPQAILHDSASPVLGAGGPATTCIDVSAQVGRKVAAIAAHRTQYPIEPDMFPAAMFEEMFDREYFTRILPSAAFETELVPTTPVGGV